MLLMCCSLQDLGLQNCMKMRDKGFGEGIVPLQNVTRLSLHSAHNLTAEALASFLHQQSTTPLDLSFCDSLNDDCLHAMAERCDKLTYLHI